jgi:hypothetical protein
MNRDEPNMNNQPNAVWLEFPPNKEWTIIIDKRNRTSNLKTFHLTFLLE